MKWDMNASIKDWSHSGRQKFVEENRGIIELIVSEALESFDGKKVSSVFGTQENAIEEIIARFLVPELNPKKLPCKDIKLFSYIGFWIAHKTGGKVSSGVHKINNLPLVLGESSPLDEFNFDEELKKIAFILKQLNQLVAPDLINYWLKANKKLLDNISLRHNLIPKETQLNSKGSNAKASRYKADACFRYMYLYLEIAHMLPREYATLYENKYLVKGRNAPQYTSSGSEQHTAKAKVRKNIRLIIDKFVELAPDTNQVEQKLLNKVARKTLLDLYEIESDFKEEYGQKLTMLKVHKTSQESQA